MERRHLFIIFLAAVIITLPFLRVTPQFYTSDANVYFHTSALLLEDQSFSTDVPRKGWIKLNESYHPAMPIGYSVFSLPVSSIFLLDPVTPHGYAQVESGFERSPSGNDWLLMRENGTIEVPGDASQTVLVSFKSQSAVRNANQMIIAQGNRIISVTNFSNTWETRHVPITIFEGENTLSLRSSRCEPVQRLLPLIELSGCGSFLLKDISVDDYNPGNPSVVNIPIPLRVSNNGSIITIENPNKDPVRARMAFNAWRQQNRPQPLTLHTGNRNYSWRIPSSGRRIVTPQLLLDPGRTNVTLSSGSPSDRCSEGKNNGCARFGVSKVSFHRPFVDDQAMFTGNWYPEDATGHRWASGSSGILITEDAEAISVELRTSAENREVDIYHNGEQIRSISLTPTWTTASLDLPSSEEPHHLQFEFSGKCLTPKELNQSDDLRCLGMAVRDTTVE
ncbi:MAG: hypothetical protein SVY41_00445 [Candidatus Nanohaloarchaea archaeon]|nr:hypothetical protein [Candidatus Nanohaloarchaea archaeon]